MRARRAGNAIVKWVGLALASLLGLVFAVLLIVALIGFYKLGFPPHRSAIARLRVVGTPEQVARGARFGAFCANCHSPNGQVPLVGRNFFEHGGPPFGTIYATNLTPAGELKDWSDDEIIRAMREGIHKSGRALVIMPSEVFHNLSDGDAQAIVAYLRAQPAAGASTPPTKLNILGALFIGAGMSPTSAQAPITQPILAPAAGVSADYGKYLVSVLACHVCHGENLAGRVSRGPGPPGGPNLTVIVPSWSAENFIRTIRTGADPSGRPLAESMPWKGISGFASDDDLRAMYTYLHALQPTEGPAK